MRRADLVSAAARHDDDAVGHRQRLFLVVGDEDRCNTKALLDATDFAAQAGTDFGVKGRQRLVQQQHLGTHGQCAGQGDALLLSAGQLKWIAVAQIGKADQREHLGHALGGLCLGYASDLKAKGDVLRDGQVGE